MRTLKEMMSVDEALSWVKKWRCKHWSKTLGVKDKALITLAAQAEKSRLTQRAADGAKSPAHEHNFENSLYCSVCGEAQF